MQTIYQKQVLIVAPYFFQGQVRRSQTQHYGKGTGPGMLVSVTIVLSKHQGASCLVTLPEWTAIKFCTAIMILPNLGATGLLDIHCVAINSQRFCQNRQ